MAGRRAIIALVCLVLAAIVFGTGAPAHAAYVSTEPPVYDSASSPDPSSIGHVTLYNASGGEVQSGSLSNLGGAVFAVVSSTGRPGATSARLLAAVPDSTATSGSWTTGPLSAASAFPVAAGTGVPSVVANAAGPVVTLNGTSDGDLATFLQGTTLDSISGYAGYLQLRVVDSGAGLAAPSSWATLEIAVDSVAGTWQQVFPVPTPMSTSISPPNFNPVSVPSGTQVRLTATVTPANATGVVHFFDGTTDLGSAQYSGGTATLDVTFTNTNNQGSAESHPITAVFTKTGLFTDSTSTASSLTITYVKAATTTNLTLSTSSPTQPSSVSATAAITVNSASVSSGSVALYIDPSNPAAPTGAPQATVTLSAGQAVYAIDTSALAAGDGCSSSIPVHTVVAKFIGTGTLDSSISSPAATFTLRSASSSCSITSNLQTTIPPGTIAISTSLTPTSPLTMPPLALNQGANEYSSSVDLTGIEVSDSRPGNGPYTLSLAATNLVNSASFTPGVNETISSQNLGIDIASLVSTNASPNTFLGSQVPGVLTGNQNFTGFNNEAASHVQSTDSGSAGLGGGVPHPILRAAYGLGTTIVAGTLHLTAPTNIVVGTYSGTLTFSVVGS